jgi:hypothetical protein
LDDTHTLLLGDNYYELWHIELNSFTRLLSRKDLPDELGPIIETIDRGAGSDFMKELVLGLSTSLPKELRVTNWMKEEA